MTLINKETIEKGFYTKPVGKIVFDKIYIKLKNKNWFTRFLWRFIDFDIELVPDEIFIKDEVR